MWKSWLKELIRTGSKKINSIIYLYSFLLGTTISCINDQNNREKKVYVHKKLNSTFNFERKNSHLLTGKQTSDLINTIKMCKHLKILKFEDASNHPFYSFGKKYYYPTTLINCELILNDITENCPFLAELVYRANRHLYQEEAIKVEEISRKYSDALKPLKQ